ncbi:MAG: hypothetical protein V4484_08025 [Pseudomonadota bacterium]
MPNYLRLPLALGVAVLVLLSGCSTTTVAVDPLKLPAQSDQSPVVVSVTANTGEIRGFDRITLTRVAPPLKAGESAAPVENFILEQVVPGMARDTSLFIGALPPGEYQFSSFDDTKTRKTLNLLGSDELGHFSVHLNKRVDLGRLLLTPVNANVVFGRSARAGSNQTLIQRFSPAHAALFAAEVESGWNLPVPKDGFEQYALSRPVGADCATERADGSVVAASRLGSVLVRSPAGRWNVVRGPGIESLLCVTPVQLPDAELLAVGEFGTLLRKPPGVNALLPVDTGDLPPGNLLRIYGNAEAGWFVAHQHGQEIKLFHSAKLEAGSWTVLRKESIAFDMWRGANSFWMWKTDAGLAYSVSTGPLRFLDFKTNQWTERATPGNDRLVALTVDPTGTMGVLTSPGGGFAGIFAGAFVTRDQAASWQPVNTPFKVKVVPVQRTADGTMLMNGGVFGASELQMSKDEGKTWTVQGKFELGRQLLVLKSGELLDLDLGQYGLFSLSHSTDMGKTWKMEYSNFDRRAYEAQKK